MELAASPSLVRRASERLRYGGHMSCVADVRDFINSRNGVYTKRRAFPHGV